MWNLRGTLEKFPFRLLCRKEGPLRFQTRNESRRTSSSLTHFDRGEVDSLLWTCFGTFLHRSSEIRHDPCEDSYTIESSWSVWECSTLMIVKVKRPLLWPKFGFSRPGPQTQDPYCVTGPYPWKAPLSSDSSTTPLLVFPTTLTTLVVRLEVKFC